MPQLLRLKRFNSGHGRSIGLYSLIMQKFTIDPKQISGSADDPRPRIRILGQDARHLGKVLRLKAGDAVSMTDGRGTDYRGEVIDIAPDAVNVRILHQERSNTESGLNLTVCSAMLKDKKMDGIIRELTQIGVTSWVPFFSKRSVPSPDAGKLANRLDRWRSIARSPSSSAAEAAKSPFHFPVHLGQSLTWPPMPPIVSPSGRRRISPWTWGERKAKQKQPPGPLSSSDLKAGLPKTRSSWPGQPGSAPTAWAPES